MPRRIPAYSYDFEGLIRENCKEKDTKVYLFGYRLGGI